MSIAIVYASRYGTTRSVAESVAARINERGRSRATLLDAGTARRADCPADPIIVVGLPIYGGSTLAPIARFLERHERKLLERRIAFFMSCLYTGPRAESQLADAVPSVLLAHAYGRYFVGGRVDFSELRPLHRFIMRRIGAVSGDVDKLDQAEVDRMVRDLVERTGA